MIIHNTLGQQDEEFKPINSGRINIFVCGPTVYDDFHIGHARTYIFFDVIAKFLRNIGYSVFYLQNITDIDDKIINRAKDENKKYYEISDYYFNEYVNTMDKLKVNSINYYARATLYIREIRSQIKIMIDKGYAYETSDGVYFSVKKFKDYGRLSNQNLNEIIKNSRGTINENKKEPEDFVLWKKMKPGEPYWESPWGKGRPGWHIEDTAITETYFGSEYDIHGGGSDLIFPHHEAEIAQMRSISGKKYLARYWVHTGMININNEKMSKSLKNFIKVKDILRDYKPEHLRFAMINANYNTSIEFSDELLNNSRDNVDKINNFYNKMEKIENITGNYNINENEMIKKFNETMENNFDTRSLIRDLFEFISSVNKNMDSVSMETAKKIIKVMNYINNFLCILYDKSNEYNNEKLIDTMIEIRNNMRNNKMYEISDYIRKKLEENNIYIEDNGNKTEWWIKD